MSMKASTSESFRKGMLKTFGVGLATAVLLICSTMSVNAGNSLSCYKGDKDNTILIGEISEADFQDPAGECNSFYADCNGECYGCYLDENASAQICVDNQGRKFTR
jgi:hypothetical protein